MHPKLVSTLLLLATSVSLIAMAPAEAGKRSRRARLLERKQPADIALVEWRIRTRHTEIRDALRDRTINIAAEEQPLGSVIKQIAAASRLPFEIDHQALADDGLDTNLRVSITAKRAPVRVVLQRLLDPYGMAWVIDEERVLITSRLGCDDVLVRREYDVEKLVKWVDQHAPKLDSDRQYLFDAPPSCLDIGGLCASEDVTIADILTQLIIESTSGQWEAIDGTGGTFEFNGAWLIVRQADRIHDELRDAIKLLNDMVSGKHRLGQRSIWDADERQARVVQSLGQDIVADFGTLTINRFATRFGKRTNINVWVDDISLLDAGIVAGKDRLTANNGRTTTARTLLDRVLRSKRMTYRVVPGGIEVFSYLQAEELLESWIFDITDLTRQKVSAEWIAEFCMNNTSGQWEKIDGTGGRIVKSLPGFLVIRQTSRVIQESALALADIRRMAQRNGTAGMTAEPSPDAWETRMYSVKSEVIASQLAKAIPKFVAPRTWRINLPTTQAGSKSAPNAGGGFFQVTGTIPPYFCGGASLFDGFNSPNESGLIDHAGRVLIVRQTIRNHQAIQRFLTEHKRTTR